MGDVSVSRDNGVSRRTVYGKRVLRRDKRDGPGIAGSARKPSVHGTIDRLPINRSVHVEIHVIGCG